jgi:hypothetical protein
VFFAYAGRTLVVKDKPAEFQRTSECAEMAETVRHFKEIYRLIWQEARQRELEGDTDTQTE